MQMGRRVPRDSYVVQIFKTDTCGVETIADRVFRKAGRVFETIETLFFDRGDQSAVFDDCRRSIAVIRVMPRMYIVIRSNKARASVPPVPAGARNKVPASRRVIRHERSNSRTKSRAA